MSIGYERKFVMMALFVVIATCISVIEIGSNQSQIAMAQQQQSQVNHPKLQQPYLSGTSFDIDNMTFSHHMASVNEIQMHYVIGGQGDPLVLLHGFPQS